MTYSKLVPAEAPRSSVHRAPGGLRDAPADAASMRRCGDGSEVDVEAAAGMCCSCEVLCEIWPPQAGPAPPLRCATAGEASARVRAVGGLRGGGGAEERAGMPALMPRWVSSGARRAAASRHGETRKAAAAAGRGEGLQHPRESSCSSVGGLIGGGGGMSKMAEERARKQAEVKLNKDLSAAAKNGNLPEVRRLLQSGANIMWQDPAGLTCLHRAAANGHLETAKHLAEVGGRKLLMKTTKYGSTCLHWAAHNGHLETAKHLAEVGGRELLMKTNNWGNTCLHLAACNGHLETAKHLAEVGGRELLMKTNNDGFTCLHWAANNGHLETAKHLAEVGGRELLMKTDEAEERARKEAEEREKLWAEVKPHKDLSEAAKNGNLPEVRRLLQSGANIMWQDPGGWTCLHEAANNGHLETAKHLAEVGGRELLMKTNKGGWTCLHWAANNGHLETAKHLAEVGGRELLMKTNNDKKTALDLAREGKKENIVAVLTAAEEEAAHQELRAAAKRGSKRTVDALLGREVDPCSKDKQTGKTALHMAAEGNHTEVVQSLLEAGGMKLMEQTTNYNKTALEVANFYQSQEAAALMLKVEQSHRRREEQARDREATASERARQAAQDYVQAGVGKGFLSAREYEMIVSAIWLNVLNKNVTEGGEEEDGKRGDSSKFNVEPSELVCGMFSDAARGISHLLQAEEDDLAALCSKGLAALRAEVKQYGKEDIVADLGYVVDEKASERKFFNGVRDKGRKGMTLDDFMKLDVVHKCKLKKEEVVALRLYTLHSFYHINNPLRDQQRVREGRQHPLQLLSYLIVRALKKLRNVNADSLAATQELILWRGMRNLKASDMFVERGGTELAPMSTTTSVKVAVDYGFSGSSLLYRIVTRNNIERGANLEWVSAFPNEAEFLFPPLTFLQPTGNTQVIEVENHKFTVVEVTVTIGA